MMLEVKLFFTFFTLLLVIFVFLIFSSHESLNLTKIKAITEITKLPGVSLSTSYFEERIPTYKDSSNRFYINVNSYSYMEYVYAQ